MTIEFRRKRQPNMQVERQALISSAQSTDYSKILAQAANVMAIGERHPNNEGLVEEVIHTLPTLRRHGFSHLGMEQLAVDSQPAVDAYQDNKDNRTTNTLRSHLKQFGWNTDGYLDIVEAATDAGIQVVALDTADKALRQSVNQTQRDLQFAGKVYDIVDLSRSGKVATFTGGAHASNWCPVVSEGTMTECLRREGVNVVSVGTVMLPVLKGYKSLVNPLEEIIQDSPLQEEAVMFDHANYADTGIPFDWVVNARPPFEKDIDKFLRHRDRLR